jgi:hypothetical protein
MLGLGEIHRTCIFLITIYILRTVLKRPNILLVLVNIIAYEMCHIDHQKYPGTEYHVMSMSLIICATTQTECRAEFIYALISFSSC